MNTKQKSSLELQNEELQRSRAEIEENLEHYAELYDLAPVGYLTLTRAGVIRQANLHGAGLLQVERDALIGMHFDQFFKEDNRTVLNTYLESVFSQQTKVTRELELLLKEGDKHFWIQIDAISDKSLQECRVMVLDITARKQTEIELQYMSMHDALTGLYNHAYFYESMKQHERGRHFPISILTADVDHLKLINDKFGHAAGDAMLVRIAQVFSAVFRAEDIVARTGGDEFAVLLPDTDATAVGLILQRFSQLLRDHNTAYPDLPLSVTFGQFTVGNNTPLEQILQLADADLYFKKRERVYPDRLENPVQSMTAAELRGRAEELHSKNYIREKANRTDVEIIRLIHELEVHQIELDLQNEELQRSRAEVEAVLKRYTDLYDFAPVGYFSLGPDGTIIQTNLNGARMLGVERVHLVGGLFGLFIRDEDRAAFTTFLKKIFENWAKETCEVALLNGTPKPLWVQIEGTVDEDGKRCRAVIVDIDARKQTEEQLRITHTELERMLDVSDQSRQALLQVVKDKEHAEEQIRQLNTDLEQRVSERTAELRAAVAELQQSEATIQTLFRISNKLNATLDVDTILDELAQEAIRIVNGESGFAGLRTADGMTMRKYFRQGVAMSFEQTWPSGKGIPGWVLQNKVPYGTSDAAQDPIFERDLSINVGVRSIICTPILDSAGEVLGYFDIRNKKDGEGFNITDQDMLMALAPAASIAIQNALAYQQRMATLAGLKESARQLQALAANLELAREEERTQISRDLHDQLGQALTAMKYDLAWLTGRLVQKDATLAQKAKAVTDQMDTMIKTVRRISTELRPGMLDDLGLAASIEWHTRDFEKRTGIICSVSVPAEDLPLGRTQSLALFRILQEAETNVARHAGARHIEVRLVASADAITLQIKDDGRGIKAQEMAGVHSLGLLGMRERANRLGGTFDIQGVPGEGTLLTVSLPIKQSE